MPNTPTNTDPLTRRFRQACAELDRTLRAGRPFYTEEWVQETGPFSTEADLAVELIFTEYVTRESLGQTPTPDEYYARFPTFADRLKRLFGVDELLKEDLIETDADAPIPLNNTNDVPVTQRDRPSNIPAKIGRYEPREILGTGGAGVVYRAWDPSLRRDVAIKVLRSGDSAGMGERERFRREAEAVARLNHRNVVQLYEVGDHENRPYIVMEFLPGGTLRSRFGGKTVPPMEAARIAKTLARAAAHAHARGIVHRDIKPGNVLLEETQSDDRSSTFIRNLDDVPSMPSTVLNPKLTDFGLAALLGPDDQPSISGNLIGTASYMAPEQAEGKRGWVTPAVDIYALGAVLYELLVGRAPFLADNPLDTLRMVVTEDPVPPRQILSTVPSDLETICLFCLRKDPAKRYPTAAALADDLHRFIDNRPIAARPAGPIERTIKWARRYPAVTAAGTIAVAALLTIAISGVVFAAQLKTERDEKEYQRLQAEVGRVDADNKRTEAELLKEKAEDLVRKTSELRYVTQLMRAGLTSELNPTVSGALLRDEDFCPPALREFTWHWLDAQAKPLVAEKTGLQGPAVALAMAATGELALSLDNTGGLQGWKPDTGELRFALKDLGSLRAIGTNAEGTAFITGDTTGLAKVWSIPAKGDPTVRLVLPKQEQPIRAVAYLSDQTLAIAAGAKCNLYSYTGTSISTIELSTGETIRSLAIAPDGASLALGSDSGTITVYSLPDRKLLRTFTGHSGPVLTLAFGPGGRVLASGSVNFGLANFLKVWDVVGNRLTADLPMRTGCWTVGISHDGATVAAAGSDGVVTLWDPVFGKAKGVFGKNVSGQLPGSAMVIDRNPARNPGMTAADIPNTIAGVAYVGQTHRFVAVGYDRVIRIWENDPNRGRVIVPATEVSAVLAGPIASGTGLLLAGGKEPVRIWNPRDAATQLPFTAEGATAIAASTDNKLVAIATPTSKLNRNQVSATQLKLVDTITGKALWSVDAHNARVDVIAFSIDGKRILTSGLDRTVKAWDTATGAKVAEVTTDGIAITVQPSASGAIFAVGKTLATWDYDTPNAPLITKVKTTERMELARGSADGSTIAVSVFGPRNLPQSIEFYDAKTFTKKSQLNASTGTIRSFALTPDGRTMAIGWADRKIRLYNLPTGQEIGVLDAAPVYANKVFFTHNGRCLLAQNISTNGPSFAVWDTGSEK